LRLCPCSFLEKQKIFGLGAFVGGEFIGSLIVELSGAFAWLGLNLVATSGYNVAKGVFRVLRKRVLRKTKMKRIIRRTKNNVGKIVLGVCVVATVFGN
jgi:hypothetical protein